MAVNNFNISGLSNWEVIAARSRYGANSLSFKKENGFTDALKGLAKAPMVILLLVTSCICFISGGPAMVFFWLRQLCWLQVFLYTKTPEAGTHSKN